MLCNNLDPQVAEDPDHLVVYGGTGKAARDWPSFDAICRSLTDLAQDETLLVQSGRPVGVLRTHEWAPRVLIANSNLVGDWATWPEFRRLEALGLTMYGQMTAGSWIYIGSQGIVQGTYETFAAVAEKLAAARPAGSVGPGLAGTLTITAGLGGMGGAQPLAVTLNGGAVLCIECDPARARRRLDTRYLDVLADTGYSEFAIAQVREAIAADPKVAGRLALWARRLVGEALGQAQRVAAQRAPLAQLLADGTASQLGEIGRLFARLTDAHAERMAALGLAE